jgi:uncharacterized membrane protein
MKPRAAAIVAALALIAAAPAASPASAPVAHSSCTNARIDGQSKCIARGQFCKRSAQRDYRRYGFSCSKRDRNGRYHLT